MTTPLVSIIMPAYNAGRFIQQAIQSVIDQEYQNWELLIVDNGSSDDTKEIIENFSEDQRIKPKFLAENVGVSAGRNTALQQASGDYLMFLDADDELPGDSISARLDRFNQDPELTFVDGAVDRIDESSKIISSVTPVFHGNPLQELLSLSGNCFIGITWMIKRVPGTDYRFDEHLTHGEDLLFFMSISGQGIYGAIDQPIYRYRKVSNSAMRNLEALENGYLAITDRIENWPSVNRIQRDQFRRAWRRIMVKSYLKEGMIRNAISLYLNTR